LSSENKLFPSADIVDRVEGNTLGDVIGESSEGSAESKTRCMGGNFRHENREIPPVCWRKSPAAVRKLSRRHIGHERQWEVR